MNELAGLIEEALSLRDPRQGIARAKQLVRNSLVRAEPRAAVRETEFFDHTFAPDLVILHPGGRADVERWVYLRTTSDPGELTDDLAAAGRTSRCSSVSASSEANRLPRHPSASWTRRRPNVTVSSSIRPRSPNSVTAAAVPAPPLSWLAHWWDLDAAR